MRRRARLRLADVPFWLEAERGSLDATPKEEKSMVSIYAGLEPHKEMHNAQRLAYMRVTRRGIRHSLSLFPFPLTLPPCELVAVAAVASLFTTDALFSVILNWRLGIVCRRNRTKVDGLACLKSAL